MKTNLVVVAFLLSTFFPLSAHTRFTPAPPVVATITYFHNDPDPGVGRFVRSGNTINYAWRYSSKNGTTYKFSFDLMLGTDWDRMQNVYANTNHRLSTYTDYVDDDPYKNTLDAIADVLADLANKNGLSKAEVALSFVQALPYDDDNHEIQRFAIETLIDCRGDCSDTAVLFAGILAEWNNDFIFLIYPNHLALGLWCNEISGGTSYTHRGREFYLAETTGTGNRIGFGFNKTQHGDGTAEIEEYYR